MINYISRKLFKSRCSINNLLANIYIILVITPYTNKHYYLLSAFIGVLWLITSTIISIKRNDNKYKCSKSIVLLYIWIMWILFLKSIGYSTAATGNYIKEVFYWLPLVMYCFYIKNNQQNQLKKMSLLIIVAIIINAIDNIRLDKIYPGIIEVITSEVFSQYWHLNFALTTFMFMSAIVILILIDYLISNKLNKVTIISIVIMIIILSNLIFISGRTTTFLILIVSIPIIITMKILNRVEYRSRCMVFIFIATVIIMLTIIISNNIVFLTGYINNSRIEGRILALFGKEGGLTESLIRFDLFKMSLQTWMSNIKTFFIGIGYHQHSNPFVVGVGQHSGFADLLGYYGIIGFTIIISIYYIFYKNILNNITNKRLKSITIILIFICMIYNVLNNIVSLEMGLIMFILLPTYNILFSKTRYSN